MVDISRSSSTRGLDASTALEFVRALRIATDVGDLTTIVSIHQASESIYQLFDKVCVIYEGKMAYFGPADEARQYFYDMGYEPAHRQTTADFLVATTDPFGRKERFSSFSIPRTATDFAAHFQRSGLGHTNRYSIESYRNEYVGQAKIDSYTESVRAERSEHTMRKSPYMISIPMQARAVMTRRMQILWGNKTAQALQFASVPFETVMYSAANDQEQLSDHAGFHYGYHILQDPGYVICLRLARGRSFLVSR